VRINWFSPLPPAESSIALDTAAVLPALAERAEVVVWTHQQDWAAGVGRHAEVRCYAPAEMPWDEVNRADATFYHIGNHAGYHGPIWRVLQQRPGIVILHDLYLQHLFAGLVVEKSIGAAEYVQMMAFHHGSRGRELAEAFLSNDTRADQVAPECPLTGAALENAVGVAVHTPIGQAALAAQVDMPVAYIPLFAQPYVVAGSDDGTPQRAARETCNLVMFGFLGYNRRLTSVLTALQQLAERDRFHLHIYGKIDDEKTILRTIDALGLKRLVTLHGFVPDAELNEALRGADLAVNLRDPSMGEASATQLRIWQHGLPALVTNTGWYATLPENTIAPVRRETEIEDIGAHFERFLQEPEVYREIGQNGRAYVNEHHTIDAYVNGLMQLVAATRETRGRESARWLAGRAGNAMRPWFTDATASVLTPRVASAIRELCRDTIAQD
jgi:glycosyltransferase involved in cell wall biosynthesis